MRRPETPTVLKGRGTTAQPANRYAKQRAEAVDDGWENLSAVGEAPWANHPSQPHWFDPDGEAPPHPETRVTEERARGIVSHNQSPDVGFDQSINPYRGCEHGCVDRKSVV